MSISFLYYPEISTENIPGYVLLILKRLAEEGFLSFLVGGCIRDLIYQQNSKDWDIVTDARPEQIQEIFNDYKTLLIGRAYQTVTLIMDSNIIHISTIRDDKKQGFGYYQKRRDYFLIRDLLRRDFTINALAWNPDKGLLDPTAGLRDLQRRVIRSLAPDIRFQKDPLRMLRAIRIACELNFTVEKKTRSSIIKYACLLHRVSPERIRGELYSIFKTSNAHKGIIMIKQFGLEHQIFSLDKIKKELMMSKKIKPVNLLGFNMFREDLSAQLALWGRLNFSSCQKAQIFYLPLIVNLKFNKRIIKKLKILLSREWMGMDFSSGIKIRFLMSELGRENTKIMFNLRKILLFSEQNTGKINKLLKEEERLLKEELQKKSPISLKDLAIRGEDLIEIGISNGKKIGEILQLLLNKVLISPESNNKNVLINIVKELRNDFNN